MPQLQIVVLQAGSGYRILDYAGRLAAELLGADLTLLDRSEPRSRWRARLGMIKPRRRGGAPCLIIAPTPGCLFDCDRIQAWSSRFGHVAVWVIDSWATEYLPRLVRYSRNIDQLFVTNPEDLQPCRVATGVPTAVMPQGTDVLRLGSANAARGTDILRIGRQPPEWDDDESSARAAAAMGLRYRGRPPTVSDPLGNQVAVMRAYSDTRFAISFSNRVDRQAYTHRTREYVTFRWLDALAGGAVVAGVAPRCDFASEHFWPGALLELPGIERAPGLAAIAEARKAWTADIAARNHREALLRLDWRWRFKAIADHFGLSAPKLDRELEEIKRRSATATGASKPLESQC